MITFTSTFALETLPLHFGGVPQFLREQSLAWAAILPNELPVLPLGSTVHMAKVNAEKSEKSSGPDSLGLWHRRRLRHSCRLLGPQFRDSARVPDSLDSIWHTLDDLRAQLSVTSKGKSRKPIYSLRYFGKGQPPNMVINNSDLATNNLDPNDCVNEVYRGKNWQLLQRPNPYCFAANDGEESQFWPQGPPWANLRRVALAYPAAEKTAEQVQAPQCWWLAKCHWQTYLAQQLKKAQLQNIYADCAEVLRFVRPASGSAPLLQEGLKSNVFLLQYLEKKSHSKLYLETPRSLKVAAPLLCGTTRNWLCRNAPRLLGVKVIQRDISLRDIQRADALLLGNAAMGLRLVRQLQLPDGSLHRYENPAPPLLRRLLALYWNAVF